MNRLLAKLRALFRKEQLEAEMAEEMRQHLERRTQEKIAASLSPDEARYAAQREFGGVEQIKERCRDARRWMWLEQFAQDVRFALRSLRKTPGFTAVVVLTLALGIGANTAIFSVVQAVLLRSLPFREPERVMRVQATTSTFRGPATAPDFIDWRGTAQSFEGMAATVGRSYNLSGLGEPERVVGTRASANYFEVLGVAPILGRAFIAGEDEAGAGGVVLLGHGFWQRRFAGDPTVLGRTLVLDGASHTIVGVLPAALEMQAASTQVWTPLVFTAQEQRSTGNRRFIVTARLRAGVTREQAEAEMRAIAEQIGVKRPNSNKGWRAAVTPLADVVSSNVRQPLLVLLGAVSLVLLIACANVASLLLARGEARQQEFAVRAALGAGGGRIARQLLTESLVLAGLGGGLGLWLAGQGIHGLVWLLPDSIPRLGEVAIDRVVLAFTAGTVLLTGVLFGLAPALRAARTDVNEALKRGGRASPAGASRGRRGLVVAEIALALVLLIGAGLLARSFWRMQAVDSGLRREPLLAVQIALPESRYPEPVRLAQFFDRALEGLQAAPDVARVGVTSDVPLGSSGTTIMVTDLARPAGDKQRFSMAYYRAASPGYFATTGVPLVMGRGLDAGDRAGGLRVAVINQAMARKTFPGLDPLGQHFIVDDREKTPIKVVGVVADVRHFGPATEPRPEIFVPYAQASESLWRFAAHSLTFVVQPRDDTAAAQAAVRRVVAAIDGDLPLYRVTTLERLRDENMAMPRTYGALLGGFASVALLLAAIGIYGAIAYTVTQRRREIGVRVALGASRGDVLRLVVGDGARLAVLGVGLGLAGAFGFTRFIASQLYGVSATDPVVFGSLALLLMAVALLACWLPARRAAKVDPMVALRAE